MRFVDLWVPRLWHPPAAPGPADQQRSAIFAGRDGLWFCSETEPFALPSEPYRTLAASRAWPEHFGSFDFFGFPENVAHLLPTLNIYPGMGPPSSRKLRYRAFF